MSKADDAMKELVDDLLAQGAAAERSRIRRELLALDIYDLTGTSESDLEAGEPVKPASARRAFLAALDRICPPEGAK